MIIRFLMSLSYHSFKKQKNPQIYFARACFQMPLGLLGLTLSCGFFHIALSVPGRP